MLVYYRRFRSLWRCAVLPFFAACQAQDSISADTMSASKPAAEILAELDLSPSRGAAGRPPTCFVQVPRPTRNTFWSREHGVDRDVENPSSSSSSHRRPIFPPPTLSTATLQHSRNPQATRASLARQFWDFAPVSELTLNPSLAQCHSLPHFPTPRSIKPSSSHYSNIPELLAPECVSTHEAAGNVSSLRGISNPRIYWHASPAAWRVARRPRIAMAQTRIVLYSILSDPRPRGPRRIYTLLILARLTTSSGVRL